MAKPPSTLVALGAFVAEYKGERLNFSQGDPIEAHHPIVAKNPHLFGPMLFKYPAPSQRAPAKAKPEKAEKPPKATAAQEAGIAASVKAEAEAEKAPEGHAMRVRPVEAATAAPGEKRGA